jgi:hypothetical protein
VVRTRRFRVPELKTTSKNGSPSLSLRVLTTFRTKGPSSPNLTFQTYPSSPLSILASYDTVARSNLHRRSRGVLKSAVVKLGGPSISELSRNGTFAASS